MGLIDAQAVRHAVCNVDIPACVTEEQFAAVLGNVCEALQMLPAVDAVPVTRCRDCVFSEYVIESNALPCYRCPYVNFDIYPDFYCAYGREQLCRKEEEHESQNL